MRVERLTTWHEAAVEELLLTDPVQNLFLLGFLDSRVLDRAHWYGALRDDRVVALAMVLHGKLCVPYALEPGACSLIGAHLRPRHPPCMLVGPREACDRLWQAWAPDATVDRRYDQRLYVCREEPAGPRIAGFRPARMSEWRVIAMQSGLMEEEDLGRNPQLDDPELHARVVRDRIQSGRTWVWERDMRLVFQINVGTQTHWGCQVGGTYVPPDLRGQGLAARGMRELCRVLVARHGLVTLHVNEANTPAVRCYERAGFERDAPFRLLTVAS